jgi:Ca2+/Na+ antiporter
VGSGLIYAVIIAMWAAYFIPLLVRRHDQLSESRSVERFSRAMRTLSRKSSSPSDRREVVMPRREAARLEVSVKRRVVSEAARARDRRSRALARRRRVLVTLLLTTVLSAVLVATGVLPWWSVLLLLVGSAAYLVHLRRTATVRRQVGRTRTAAQRRSDARARRREAAVRVAAARESLTAEEREAAQTAARLAADHEKRLQAARAAEAAAAWSPLPVHVPTYVTKPRAPGPERRLDVDRILAEETAVAPPRDTMDPVIEHYAEAAVAHEREDEEIDAIIERRRAVND